MELKAWVANNSSNNSQIKLMMSKLSITKSTINHAPSWLDLSLE
jgi:hypothetical protein